jgi:hypothetical protein
MNSVRSGVSPVLFGSKGHVGVSRGLAEFTAVVPSSSRQKNETLLALPLKDSIPLVCLRSWRFAHHALRASLLQHGARSRLDWMRDADGAAACAGR